mmetsp:Transcript_11683/g.25283  ORF Transcript_11683/g.25283 Transcript_11683/m.25283 type:complete len:85 (-) Transcript_11683:1322-1576(-)
MRSMLCKLGFHQHPRLLQKWQSEQNQSSKDKVYINSFSRIIMNYRYILRNYGMFCCKVLAYPILDSIFDIGFGCTELFSSLNSV